MKIQTLAAVAALLALTAVFTWADPLGTAFTYQGRLRDGAGSAEGIYDFRFAVYDAASGPVQVSDALTNSAVVVSNGLFGVTLDFGPGMFTGEARWLEIAVRTNGVAAFTLLDPRQELTPAPYAHYAPSAGTATSVPAANLTGTLPDSRLSANIPRLNGDATFSGQVQFGNPLDRFAGSFVGDGSGVLNVALGALNSGGAISVSNSFALSSAPGAGGGPTSLVTADVDGDRWPDLISANFNSGSGHTLTILTNNQHGGFALSSSPTVGTGPLSVTAADVNGDGWWDLVSANMGDGTGNTLSVLTNNGRGGFALWSSPRVGRMPTCVAVADVNADGRADLISADGGDDQLTVLTNNGSGGFVAASTCGFAYYPFWVLALDVNGDTSLDLVASLSYPNQLVVLTNSGGGRFQQAGLFTVGEYPRRITAADLNGDGRVDLVSADTYGDSLTVLTNNGRGGFGLAASLRVGDSGAMMPVTVQALDVNADGRLDLVSANAGYSSLTVFTNAGRDGFRLAYALGAGNGLSDVVAADLNGDGQPDLATANAADNTLSVLLGSRQVSFVGDGSGLTGVSPAISTVGSPQLVQDPASLSKVSGGAMTSSAGNIGVGTTNPASKLEVMGTVTASAFVGNGAGLTNLNAGHLASGRLPSACLTGSYSGAVTFDNPGSSFAGNGAALTGLNADHLNSGTVPDARLGTNVAFLSYDAVFRGMVTAGGDELQGNRLNIGVANSFRIVPGTALRPGATIAGGTFNTNATDYGTIGGGENNLIRELAMHAHIGGGKNNAVSEGAEKAHIGGGENNLIRGSAGHAHIGGGQDNDVKARAQQAHIGGGERNVVEEDAVHAHIGGGKSNLVDKGAGKAHIGGGENNRIRESAGHAHIGGGRENEVQARSAKASIGGGEGNVVETDATRAHIGGGKENAVRASSPEAHIGGGERNVVEPDSPHAHIGGGKDNAVQARASKSHIGGGEGNVVQPDAVHAHIGGGRANIVRDKAEKAHIGGGANNEVASAHASVGGGWANTIQAHSDFSTIGGGSQNRIGTNALSATVPGGSLNLVAASHSLAAGYRAKALHTGSFVWADSADLDTASTNANSWTVRASGGMRFFSDTNATVGAYLPPGGNGFSPMSDRNVKENFRPVDPRAVLEKVSHLPVTEWNLISQPAGTRHIGPMAQDFQALFGVGEDDKHISTTDADGVALAAIQGLNQKVEARSEKLQAENAELKARVERLEQLLNSKHGGAK